MGVKTRVLTHFKQFPRGRASSVCIGNFDGIHRAHQKILKECLRSAKRRKLASVVFTFDPHPSKYFSPAGAPKLLMTKEERRELLSKMGFDFILEQRFNRAFVSLSAEKFVSQVLVKALNARVLTVGSNFRFGFRAQGNLTLLRKLKCFQIRSISPIKQNQKRLSSTRIRKLISRGDISEANLLLGHSYFLSGKVIRGFQRGRKLGFPTANIQTARECLPKPGVYVTYFFDIASKKKYPSVTSVGFNPTFKNSQLSIESFLLDFQGNLYGKKIKLSFLRRLRNEKKFSNLDRLKSQMSRDVREARRYFLRGASIF